MPFTASTFGQASLAATMFASTVGSYMASTPPNPSVKPPLATGDLLHRWGLTESHSNKVVSAPLLFLTAHTAALALSYPQIPQSLLRNGAANGLNRSLITWSASTAIPLALILCVAVPLRLVPYSALGKNFTFALAEPDRLVTSGIYSLVQHPSYTGMVALMTANAALLYRVDGALSCWIPRRWYERAKVLQIVLTPLAWGLMLYVMGKRVQQEEQMLRSEFGVEWEKWHAATARFIPWIF